MCLVSFAKSAHYSALQKVRVQDGRPKWAYVVICDDCSHKCGWCYGGFNNGLRHAMRYEDYLVILERCRELGIVQVTIAGGEPTEHPEFLRFVEATSRAGFLVHVASHGEHVTPELARSLRELHVRQVQLNFQGRRHHDRIHGVPGSHARQVAGLRALLAEGLEVTTTTTVGAYNLGHVDEIFEEAAGLGVTRLRVWEATGLGNRFRKDLEAAEIFARCREAAARLGYAHVLSYDPVFEGDVSVACLQLSDLFLYVSSAGRVVYCGAVPGGAEIADLLHDPAPVVLEKYLRTNARQRQTHGTTCAARAPAEPALVRLGQRAAVG